jgi:protein O-GlcNAc transferase
MALCSYVYLAKNICDWETTASLSRRLDAVNRTAIERGEKPPEPPFSNMTRHADPALNRTIARAWAREAAERMVGEPAAFDFMARRSRRDRLRIGYLSNNFGDHPVALLMQSLYGLHDRDRFEVFCYSYGKDDGSRYRTKIEHDCDEFVDIVESSDRDSARKIFADGIDILVDLVGHTQDSRLTICAYRPAPIQVHYLGYPGTTGADYIDYLITDRIVTPEAEADLYDEKFAYMPHGYQINDCPAELPASRYKRRDFGVPEKSFVFCCFNRGYKIEPEIFDAWMGMLREVDDSVLWLVRGGEPGDANLRRAAGQRGVDPDRLIFAEPLRLEHHLGRVQLADLALDTHIYNGGATTSHTLTSGVPLITIRGPHFLSRMSASVLIGAGLPELVAAERREYQELAIRLARDPSELASLRARVAQCRRSSPVFDTLRFVTDLESRYEKMWEIFQSGEEPRQIG